MPHRMRVRVFELNTNESLLSPKSQQTCPAMGAGQPSYCGRKLTVGGVGLWDVGFEGLFCADTGHLLGYREERRGLQHIAYHPVPRMR